MSYKVLDRFPVGDNTSVTVKGTGKDLRNDIIVKDEHGNDFNLISVAMMAGHVPPDEEVTMLIEGDFLGNKVIV